MVPVGSACVVVVYTVVVVGTLGNGVVGTVRTLVVPRVHCPAPWCPRVPTVVVVSRCPHCNGGILAVPTVTVVSWLSPL